MLLEQQVVDIEFVSLLFFTFTIHFLLCALPVLFGSFTWGLLSGWVNFWIYLSCSRNNINLLLDIIDHLLLSNFLKRFSLKSDAAVIKLLYKIFWSEEYVEYVADGFS